MTSKMEKLWAYQKADLDAFRLQREMSQSPKRIKLVQSREFLLKQKNVIEKISADVLQMSDRIDAVQGALNDLDKQMKALIHRFEESKPQDVEAARELMLEVKRLSKDIIEFEKEIKAIQKKSNDRSKQEYDVRINAARVKQEFNQLKAEYEPEHEEQMKKHQELLKIAESMAAAVDAELFQKYNAIKQHVMPPLAMLKNNQCGGCDMSLPSVTLSEFDSGKDYVECSNCGRLIIK